MADKKQQNKTQETPEQQNSTDDTQQNNDMVYLGGVWANRDKNGQIYFSGYLGNAKLFLFKNKNKTNDKQPDFYMQIANNTKKQSVDGDELEKELGDDIPF